MISGKQSYKCAGCQRCSYPSITLSLMYHGELKCTKRKRQVENLTVSFAPLAPEHLKHFRLSANTRSRLPNDKCTIFTITTMPPLLIKVVRSETCHPVRGASFKIGPLSKPVVHMQANLPVIILILSIVTQSTAKQNRSQSKIHALRMWAAPFPDVEAVTYSSFSQEQCP